FGTFILCCLTSIVKDQKIIFSLFSLSIPQLQVKNGQNFSPFAFRCKPIMTPFPWKRKPFLVGLPCYPLCPSVMLSHDFGEFPRCNLLLLTTQSLNPLLKQIFR